MIYSSSRRISHFIRILTFFYLANEIKEAEKKKADETKQIKTIVKINYGGRGGGMLGVIFVLGIRMGVRVQVLRTTEGDIETTHVNIFN